MNFIYKRIFISLIILSFYSSSLSFSQERIAYKEEQEQESNSIVTLAVKNMGIVDVLKILADRGKLNLSISGNVRGKITLFLKDIDIWDALEIVVISGALAYEKRGKIIYIMTEREYELKYGKKYEDKRKLRVFNLKYAKASKVGPILSQMASNIGKVIVDEQTATLIAIDIPEKIVQMNDVISKIDKPLRTDIFELNYLSAKDLEQRISEILTKEIGSLKIDEATNKIIVTDYPDKVKIVENLIRAFDEKPLQVLINAKIIELTPSKKFYSGINWDYWMEKYFRIKGDFAIPSPTGVSDKVRFGTIGVADVAGKGDYSAIIDFLKIFGEVKVLSSPRIVVLNNEEAKILVGTKDVYITSTISQTGTGTSVTAQTVNFVDVGVKLYVTPTINRAGYITLKIKPEVSSAERTSITSEGQETDIPVVTTSEAETSLIVKDGVSIIIGGLRKITVSREKKQVPFLGKIPLLGALFRNNKNEWTKNELVILLTPRIVSGDRSIELELQGKMGGDRGETEVLEEFKKEDIKKNEGKEPGGLEREETKEMEKTVIKEAKKENIEEDESKKEEKEKKEPQGTEKEEIRDIEGKEEGEQRKSEQDSYYLQVRERIKFTASLFESKAKGKVKVRFVLSKEGELLGEPYIISSNSNKILENISKEIIKKSSPFPPLPDSKEKEIFEILISF